jgi:ribosome-binding factor A
MKRDLFADVKSLSAPQTERPGKRRGPETDPDLREARALVAQLRPDDGLDPREEARRRRPTHRGARPGQAHGTHKEEQLFAQVQMAIEGALQTAVNPVLNALTVREVARQRGALAVIVEPRIPAEPVDAIEAAQALDQAASMLRREVAAAITRKEVPRLSFVVLPAEAQKVDA